MNDMSQDDKDQALFSALLYSLHASGMQQMGKVANPMTGKVERDLTQAQYTIDMLDMLKRRTEGNRKEPESKLMTRMLAELQMNYVDEVKADKEASKKPDSEEPEENRKTEDSGSAEDAEKGGTPGDSDGKTETERSSG